MNGEFVQVSREHMAQLLKNPDAVEQLFVEPALQPSALRLTSTMRKNLQQRMPQVLAGVMAQNPAIGKMFADRFGVSVEGLKSGEGVDVILKAMEKRGLFRSVEGEPPEGPIPRGSSGAPETNPKLSIDKAWHGLHYLLSGTAELEPGTPIVSRAVVGGTEIGDDFSGYGPARYFSVEQVPEIARELARPALRTEMSARYNPAQMVRLEIYPGGWDRDGRRGYLRNSSACAIFMPTQLRTSARWLPASCDVRSLL